MAEFLWKKDDTPIDEAIMAFLAGEDVLLDQHIFLFDIEASRAHVGGLNRIGLISDDELKNLDTALSSLAAEFRSGDFVLDRHFEDGHSAIEFYLTDKLGETGKKVHAGRSRNDQVLVATRLFLVDALGQLGERCCEIAEAFLKRAETDGALPMPGYTHLQHAVVSSAGLWFASCAEAFIDNAVLAGQTREWVSSNPLGTAAGFGVNLPLDREYTTGALKFSRMQINPMYAQNSRGKFELQGLSAMLQAMLDLRRFSWDLSLYMTPEFGFVDLPDQYTTGSSIMPNKRNPDLVELLRGECATSQAALAELSATLSLPGGYHRDLQLTKAPLLRGFIRGLAALRLVPGLVRSVILVPEKMRAGIEAEMYATDRAMELVAKGAAFREAYREALQNPEELAGRNPEDSLTSRNSPGAPGNLCLDELRDRLARVSEAD
ncbi:MAG: argininosuccinate lyase [Gammaproteobacteria bacterium]|nr:argininosuccinate lyase [Gammaproteobacteria bacterium]